MRSIVGSGMVLALFLIALPRADHAAAAPGDVLSTNRTNVNVRATPSTTADIVATINADETIIEINTKGEWHFVSLPGRDLQGWIFSPLLETSSTAPAPSINTRSEPVAPVTEAPRPAPEPSRTAAFDGNLAGDPANGETVFYKCGSCHTTVPGVHAQGPSLVGVFGSRPAQSPGFRYSGAMQAFARDGAVWDEATLDEFIRRPARLVKGTSMPFSGVRDPKDRRDLIAYLQQLAN